MPNSVLLLSSTALTATNDATEASYQSVVTNDTQVATNDSLIKTAVVLWFSSHCFCFVEDYWQLLVGS